jgi:atypical dual specificity phosphatase
MVSIRAISRLPRQVWTYARLKPVTWLDDVGLAACSYPRDERALRALAERGVATLINLHERPHAPEALARCGLAEVHLPVPDFAAPTPAQLAAGVAAIERAVAGGRRAAVHCGAGLGRTGTLLACYLVQRGLGPDEAIARVRAARPGSVETAEQEAAVAQFARRAAARPTEGA